MGIDVLGDRQAVSQFRGRFESMAKGKLTRLGNAVPGAGRYNPSALYAHLITALAPLAQRGLIRPNAFVKERRIHADTGTGPIFDIADELLERLIDYAAVHGDKDLHDELRSVQWSDIPRRLDLESEIAALTTDLEPESFLYSWDRAVKGFFYEYTRVFTHDELWYAIYIRELENCAFLVLSVKDEQLEQELNRFLSLLFIVYPSTWRSRKGVLDVLWSRAVSFYNRRFGTDKE